MAETQVTRATWRNSLTFDVAVGKHQLVMDGNSPSGKDDGPQPTEVLLTALAACTGMDVISILLKKRQPVKSLKVLVEGKRADEHPRVFTEIQVVYYVRGEVTPAALARSIELSETKYCPISIMLRQSCPINSRFEIESVPVTK
ncbi:MAG TPA: OsmC family protein [Anaerolineae bacterium]|nr:OsmC family protein [Anaerolineae bacterium]